MLARIGDDRHPSLKPFDRTRRARQVNSLSRCMAFSHSTDLLHGGCATQPHSPCQSAFEERREKTRATVHQACAPPSIVATYEQPRWLDLSLRAWARQSLRPDAVIVADDGSGPATAEVVRRWNAVHVRTERDGSRFGKCGTVNAASAAPHRLGCDFALFTDGDCLPSRRLLARHVESPGAAATPRAGWFASRASSRKRSLPSQSTPGRSSEPRATSVATRCPLRSAASSNRSPAAHSVERRQLLGVPRRRPASQRLRRAVRLGLRGQGARRPPHQRGGSGFLHPLHRARLPSLARPAVRRPSRDARNRALLSETRRTGSTWTPSGIEKTS